MTYAEFFEEIKIITQCAEVFFEIEKRACRGDFEEKVQISMDRIRESDKSFGAYLPCFAREENLTPEELNLYIYLRMLRQTYDECKKRGIPDEVFAETADGINRNANRCKAQYGMFGVPQKVYRDWLRLIVLGKLFSLNKGFMFEIRESECAGDVFGRKLEIGDTIISIHIPTGFRLEKAEYEAAIEDARAFFGQCFGMENIVFRCRSWLMHPWLRDALGENSRILGFQKSFVILQEEENLENVMFWVFPGHSAEDISTLPRDTSLQRACIENIKNKVPMGIGTGFRI